MVGGIEIYKSRKNGSFHRGIGRSPYEAMFGTKLRRHINGLGDADLPNDIRKRRRLGRSHECR
jgi:hypothetical protein